MTTKEGTRKTSETRLRSPNRKRGKSLMQEKTRQSSRLPLENLYAMNSAGSSIWGILVCALATGSQRRQLPLTVACYRWGTLLMSRHRDRRRNLFLHLQKPQARSLHLATHTTRRLYSTHQITWIHLHQSRNPTKNVLTIMRRYVLSAQIHHTAVTQVPRLRSRLRSGTKKTFCTKLARFESSANLTDCMIYYTMKVTGWNPNWSGTG